MAFWIPQLHQPLKGNTAMDEAAAAVYLLNPHGVTIKISTCCSKTGKEILKPHGSCSSSNLDTNSILSSPYYSPSLLLHSPVDQYEYYDDLTETKLKFVTCVSVSDPTPPRNSFSFYHVAPIRQITFSLASNAKLRSCDVYIGFHGNNPNLMRFCKWLKSKPELQGIACFIADQAKYVDGHSHEMADRIITYCHLRKLLTLLFFDTGTTEVIGYLNCSSLDKESKYKKSKGGSCRILGNSVININGILGKMELALEFGYSSIFQVSLNLRLDISANIEKERGEFKALKSKNLRHSRELFRGMLYLLIIDNLEIESERKFLHKLDEKLRRLRFGLWVVAPFLSELATIPSSLFEIVNQVSLEECSACLLLALGLLTAPISTILLVTTAKNLIVVGNRFQNWTKFLSVAFACCSGCALTPHSEEDSTLYLVKLGFNTNSKHAGWVLDLPSPPAVKAFMNFSRCNSAFVLEEMEKYFMSKIQHRCHVSLYWKKRVTLLETRAQLLLRGGHFDNVEGFCRTCLSIKTVVLAPSQPFSNLGC
ncbi:hypothetical protein K2173_010486 [Erythroxylum novogranatense]|uniref:Plant disease resistance WDH domain-containing protein n=1 Tax=Erythroxylum novogranatense TaxID=1862640 RepID=A0AAV8TG91_9ROSI|nr:hypothetical protein K2173_010486 [Erythroxylum novogranatense]